MTQSLPGSIVALGRLSVALAVAIGWSAGARAETSISGAVLQQNIPGSKINLNTPIGSVVPISYNADGSLEGSAGAVAFYLGSATDRGKWWIDESKLCHQWNSWFNGRKQCFSLRLKAHNQVEWTDQDGDKGTGTVVKLGSAPVEAQKPVVAASVAERAVERVEPPAPPAVPVTASQSEAVRRMPARAAVTEPPRSETPVARIAVARVAPSVVAKPQATPVSAAPAGPTFRVVNVAAGDVLNVRREASATSEVVSTIHPRSSGVQLTSACVGEWCPVRFGTSAGWVHQYFIEPEQGARKAAPAADVRSVVTYRVIGVPANDTLNVRRLANGDSDVVGTIPANGRQVRMTGFCVREWCPVVHAGKAGWVNRQYLALAF